MHMIELVLIAHNLRSSHNVGSLLRTAEGLGVGKLWLTGYSPYPLRETPRETDTRLPHLAAKVDQQIRKTALGAESQIDWQHQPDIEEVLGSLKSRGFQVAALEQASGSIALPGFKPPQKLALVLGHEVEGLESEILGLCDMILEIPMAGQKESFNVVQAAAMALYHCQLVA